MLLICISAIFIAFSPCWAIDEPVAAGSEVKVLPPGVSEAPPASAQPQPGSEAPLLPGLSSEAPKASGAPEALPPLQPEFGAEPKPAVNASLASGEVNPERPAEKLGEPAAPAAGAAAPLAPAANASSPNLANPAPPSLELESNASLANAEGKKENASLPIEEAKKPNLLPEEKDPFAQANSSIPLPVKPLPNNESAVDLGAIPAKGKNDSDLINELLANGSNPNDANPNSTAKFLLPSKIDKIRLTVIGFTGKPVHTFNLSEHQILYQMKVFWGEPESWQDIGYPPSDRLYEVFCWLTVHGGYARDLFRGNLSSALDQHSQWYAFPEAEDANKNNISANCGLRPVNGAGKGGDWTFSEPAPIREAPVFLRGFENVNVRGWSKEEVVRLIRNQKRQDSPQKSAKSKSKSRRS